MEFGEEGQMPVGSLELDMENNMHISVITIRIFVQGLCRSDCDALCKLIFVLHTLVQ